jgi:DNA-binding transcriptional LysR family regulator
MSGKGKGKRKDSVRLVWLEAFVAVARKGSLREAAYEVDVDPTVVGRYLDLLEEWLNCRLILNRTPLKLSPAGTAFNRDAKEIVRVLNSYRVRRSKTPISGAEIDMSWWVPKDVEVS